MTISTFLGIGSYTFGFNQKLTAHFRFARSLENPAGFNQALRNINARLRGPEHFPYGVPERREESVGVALGPGVTALSKNPNANKLSLETTESGEDWTFSQSQEEPDQNQGESPYVTIRFHASCVIPGAGECDGFRKRPCALTVFTWLPMNGLILTKFRLLAQQTGQPSVKRPPSKWDEIRTANNKAGSPSSWDLIRQNHERNKMSLSPSSQSSTRSHTPAGGAAGTDNPYDRDGSPGLDSPVAIDKSEKQWDSRAFDEAQFEAVLEAERRRASKV